MDKRRYRYDEGKIQSNPYQKQMHKKKHHRFANNSMKNTNKIGKLKQQQQQQNLIWVAQ